MTAIDAARFRSRRARRHAGALFAAALLLSLVAPAVAAVPPSNPERPGSPPSVLDPARAVAIRNLTLDWGMGTLNLTEGVLVPVVQPATAGATAAAATPVELVFAGHGTLRAAAPDPTEASQLELFTGSPELDAPIDAAVLVMPRGADRLLARGSAPDAALAEELEIASGVWDGWREGHYRRLLGVEGALFAAAAGDPWASSGFAGWFRSEKLGELVAVVDPTAQEQVTLGQFVPVELTRREAKAAGRYLHRQQRQGRLLGLSVDQLGQFDTWMSASLQRDGEPRPGFAPFDPVHYALEVSLGEPETNLRGRATVTLRSTAVQSRPRTVTLLLNRDLVLSKVVQAGTPCEYVRGGEELIVALASPPEPGATFELVFEYEGKLLEEGKGRAYPLRDTVFWYPRTESLVPATYDVRLEWPARLELVASGERVEGGGDERRRWERRALTTGAPAFSFELGAFETVTASGARVPVRVHFDRGGQELSRDDRRQIAGTAADALDWLEETFGPYPHSELNLVTVDRPFSQSMPGLISLSNLMMADLGVWGVLLGLEDRKTVIAHEVAHQWWGHQVGWRGYRDLWISEGVATFSAMAYARARLDIKEVRSPTQWWQLALGAQLEDGRTIEAVGPLALGTRLISSRGEDAYEQIIYRKGAVVLDMLTQHFGEEAFLQMLRGVVTAAGGSMISTDDMLAMLERQSGSDLSDFAARFVHGTGVPEVYYQTSFDRLEDGRWRVAGEARQLLPQRFTYRAVHEGERWDVRRERKAEAEGSGSLAMVVPVRIPVLMKDAPAPKGDEDANGFIEGRVLLQGERTPIEMEIDHEPRELWLDPEERVLAFFFNARREPKRVALYEGAELAASGKPDEAEARLREGLRLAVSLEGDESRYERRELDGRIRLELARLYLDRGDDAAADAELHQALEQLGSASPWRPDADLLALRRQVRQGRYPEAAKGLSKMVLKRGSLDSTEAYVLLAIAAKQAGRGLDLVKARQVARERGADLSALD